MESCPKLFLCRIIVQTGWRGSRRTPHHPMFEVLGGSGQTPCAPTFLAFPGFHSCCENPPCCPHSRPQVPGPHTAPLGATLGKRPRSLPKGGTSGGVAFTSSSCLEELGSRPPRRSPPYATSFTDCPLPFSPHLSLPGLPETTAHVNYAEGTPLLRARFSRDTK